MDSVTDFAVTTPEIVATVVQRRFAHEEEQQNPAGIAAAVQVLHHMSPCVGMRGCLFFLDMFCTTRTAVGNPMINERPAMALRKSFP